MYCSEIPVNHEYFDVKIFLDSMACAKIKRTKYMRNINDNAVQGRLSENYLTRKIITWNILDTKYPQFMVLKYNRLDSMLRMYQRNFGILRYYGNV